MIRPCDMMTVAMARLIHDGDTVFHGVSSHMPMIATLLARRLHAPNAVHLNIPGGVDPVKPALREFTSAGGELWETACAGFPLMEVFDLSMRGVPALLLEQGGLAHGTSSRFHGLLHSGARYAQNTLYKMLSLAEIVVLSV